jgi:hypothetical protein
MVVKHAIEQGNAVLEVRNRTIQNVLLDYINISQSLYQAELMGART